MTAAASALLLAAVVVAAADWWAVATRRTRLETFLKPVALALLAGAALLVDPTSSSMRWWFVAGLVASLVGDVLLLPTVDRFVAGLASFLVGHLLYVAGFVAGGVSSGRVAAAAVACGLVLAGLAPPILRGIRRRDHPELVPPVVAYMLVISAMVVTAAGHGRPAGIAGAVLFYVSDALIAWTRFVADVAHGRLAVMVTYHLGQALLVVGLI